MHSACPETSVQSHRPQSAPARRARRRPPIPIYQNVFYTGHSCGTRLDSFMFEVRQTEEFMKWRSGLKDKTTQRRIAARIDRLEFGNFGDTKVVGGGVVELRLDFGPGYRVYFVRRGDTIVVLLCGGDKTSQQRDINRAKEMAQWLED
jgi:putative addiction module killer protein